MTILNHINADSTELYACQRQIPAARLPSENFHSVILIVHVQALIISRIFVQFIIVNISNPVPTHDIILQGEHGKIDGFEFCLYYNRDTVIE